MRISDWSSDVCSSDLANLRPDIVSFIAELNVLQPYCTSDDAKTLACLDSPTKTFPQGTSGAPCARPRRRSRASAPIDAGPRFTKEDAADQSTAGIIDRKSVVSGKSVSVRVDLVGGRVIKKKKNKKKN